MKKEKKQDKQKDKDKTYFSERDIKRIEAYQAKIKEVSRARVAIASLKQTIGNILGNEIVSKMYAIVASVSC